MPSAQPRPQVRAGLSQHCSPREAYALLSTTAASPPAIGSHTGYIRPPHLRLVLTLGIYCLPSCDWSTAVASPIQGKRRVLVCVCKCGGEKLNRSNRSKIE
eukprot:567547-Prorocentrum_minimum.AAC.1